MHYLFILKRKGGEGLFILVYLCLLLVSCECGCNKDVYTPAPTGTPGKVVDLDQPALEEFIKSIAPGVSLKDLDEA